MDFPVLEPVASVVPVTGLPVLDYYLEPLDSGHWGYLPCE
jgi:hypothetical protein